MIDGVCGGIAEYFEVDPVLVRIVWVLLFIFGGLGLIAYILAAIIIPRRPLEEEPASSSSQQASPPPSEPPRRQREGQITEPGSKGSLVIGIILVAFGAIFLIDNLSFFRGFYVWGWFRHHFWDFIVPGLFIVAGVALLVRSSDKAVNGEQ